ncbi:MAG: redoxin domain-containing protein [Planctomycetes bacterium]|nr:redoxin domain-containing protein [Planctomycetota bacterium]
MTNRCFVRCVSLIVLTGGYLLPAFYATGIAEEEKSSEVLAGHSYHGAAFNEGPRQKAYLMEGTGRVDFPVTTKSEEAQKFITQGVGQLHGFWYFEAERSFRQAAALDPDCAMAYWGLAMANTNNAERAKEFIAKAVERKSSVTPREAKYIDALDAWHKADAKKKKERAEAYVEALERLIYDHPEDREAKAFLGVQLWQNRGAGIPIASHLAVEALLKDVLEVEPLHPCHHYLIHLWDLEKPARALYSAAKCGPAAPAIAHMWHMPGHIYSRLKRYHDAAWQQEASARVDHAHMMRDRVLPDQIHNFAHNNEWLIRNLIHVGRMRDATGLAKNMIELPRHPKYNTLKKRGSAQYGRMRLLDALNDFEQWDALIALADTPYLEPTDDADQQIKRLRHLGRAHYRKGDFESGAKVREEVEAWLQRERDAQAKAESEAEAQAREKNADKEGEELDKLIKKAKDDARKPFSRKIRDLERATWELQGHQLTADGKPQEAHERLKKAGGVDPVYLARVELAAGKLEEAEKNLRRHVDSHKNEVVPLAGLIDLLWTAGKQKEAGDLFDELRKVAWAADLDAPPLERLSRIAQQLGLPEDWRQRPEPPNDLGERPDLDSLGPFRWQPSPAPTWTLQNAEGRDISLTDYRGRPVVVIFYLGFGCLHCVEQLQAFAPQAEAYKQAGIELVAIGSDDHEGLCRSIENYDGHPFSFPLLSDPELRVFQAYRCYDDFESLPLHGTFLIDGEGKVRWQDISYEPFMDHAFLLKEAKRLLGQ